MTGAGQQEHETGADAPAARADEPRPAGWRLFLGFYALFLVFAWPGPPLDPIAARHLALAEAMGRGRVGVGPLEADIAADLSLQPLPDGTYPPHHFGPGVSALAAPICAVVDLVAPPRAGAPPAARQLVRTVEAWLVLALLVAPAGALSVVVLARALARAGLPGPEQAARAFGLGLVFPLSTTIGPHVVALACAAAGLLLASARRHAPAARVGGGFLVGFSVLCDPGFALSVAVPLGVWVLWRDRRTAGPFVVGAGAAAALFFARNAVYYGHWLRPRAPFEALPPALVEGGGLFYGTTDVDPAAALHLLVGGRIGLFVVAPALVMGLVGLPELWRRRRDVALVVVVVSLVALLQNVAVGGGWYSGTTKGPRYLLPAAIALAVPTGCGLVRWPRLGGALVVAGALISWVQAQTPFFAELRSSIEDVLAFGPRLRIVHTVGALVAPARDVSGLALVLSPLLAFPALAGVTTLLAPSDRRRRVLGVVVGAWGGIAVLSQLAPADSRQAIRLRELRRQVPSTVYPKHLEWYGDELLAAGLPLDAATAYLKALELGGWAARGQARVGLRRVVDALLAAEERDAAARVLGRARALEAASVASVSSER